MTRSGLSRLTSVIAADKFSTGMRPKNLRDGDMDIRAPDQRYNPYRIFSREQWAELRNDTPMTLEPGEFSQLRSMHDRLDLKEVEEIYLPLSRLFHRLGPFLFSGVSRCRHETLSSAKNSRGSARPPESWPRSISSASQKSGTRPRSRAGASCRRISRTRLSIAS